VIDPLVRVASPADDVALGELESEARAGLAGRRGGDRWLEEHAPRPWTRASTVTWVAHVDGVVVGYLVLDLVDGEIARIETVYVTPGARELGFGDALLDAARTEALRRGAGYLEGEALPGDRDTKNLYERAGITARLITVSTALDAPGSTTALDAPGSMTALNAPGSMTALNAPSTAEDASR
jgi:GNAT superfamily N-acetyltransferase